MDNPKISVITPMYNRKHYIEQCIDSMLAQTFKDFEFIIRDDGSTDGSADFVEEKYCAEIKSGKIKLMRNEKNIGEFPTDNRLLHEATGKYIMILHSDDMFLPQALEYMYEIAEYFNADVVHECKYFTTNPDGIIEDGKPLNLVYYDNHQVDTIELIPYDPIIRFNEWDLGGTKVDAPHNIFKRKFLADNDLRFESFGGNRLLALQWIMKAKILVKTPLPFYIYRNSPDSTNRAKISPERVTKFISDQIELSRYLNKFFATDDFFKSNPEFQHRALSHLFLIYDTSLLKKHGAYKDGITPELHQAVEAAFKKYFGDDFMFPTFLFHLIHTAQFNQPVNMIKFPKRMNF